MFEVVLSVLARAAEAFAFILLKFESTSLLWLQSSELLPSAVGQSALQLTEESFVLQEFNDCKVPRSSDCN